LSIPRKTFYDTLRRHQIDINRFRRSRCCIGAASDPLFDKLCGSTHQKPFSCVEFRSTGAALRSGLGG
ncbi:MAG: hypothetical protein V4559_10160, partial [Pseudomonadota bacterium]